MAYPFFDNREYTEYKSLVLRAGEQDQAMSKIRDELSAGLLEGTDVNFLYQAYKPYVLYLKRISDSLADNHLYRLPQPWLQVV